MEEEKLYLVSLDTDKIHSYIFATDKLKEIRGASAILNDLNNSQEVKQRVEGAGGLRCIYAAGGAAKAIFGDKDKAKKFILEERALYENESISATITGSIEETAEDELIQSFGKVNERGEKKLRKNKESKCINSQLYQLPYSKICKSCGLYPVSKRIGDDFLCKSCEYKRNISGRNILYNAFTQWLGNNPVSYWPVNIAYDNPEDIGDIGEESDNYIGLIYCDGNRMGQKIQGINNEKEFSTFSLEISRITKEEIFRAVAENMKPIPKSGKNYYPFEFVLIGGDDVIVLVPGNRAIKVAHQFCKNFHLSTIQKNMEVSISAGVVIAHSKFPLFRLFTFSDDLLKSAKKLSNRLYSNTPKENASVLDFALITTSSTNELDYIRDKELSYEEGYVKLYQRPYRVLSSFPDSDDLTKLLLEVERFKQIPFPKNKLAQMYNSLFKGKGQAMYELLLLKARLKPKVREVLDNFSREFNLDKFPWKDENGEYSTPILDLIEIYDFIE
ncbi:MAG: hypothetical protein A3G93_03495 [Nitrospinae bacterium RIFCSPLOWO2_12_FULL_45_22]|nr:MAG: hypothetical protein A3G93_03495 [Nitrospinae bacterium RIFCSPLOWO2_12_FULL_45_22]